MQPREHLMHGRCFAQVSRQAPPSSLADPIPLNSQPTRPSQQQAFVTALS